MRIRSLLTYASFGALTAGAAALGALASRKGANSAWYERLPRPRFQPPDKVFAPVWSVLYGLIAASGARTFLARRSRVRTRALTLWGIQLALNVGWPAIFFGARRPRAALVEILALLASITAYTSSARKADRAAALLVVPYLAWTGFATLLNAAIVRELPGREPEGAPT